MNDAPPDPARATPPPLARRALARHGPAVSVLGLGTVKLGRDRGVRYPTPVRIPDDRAVVALLEQARALGINLLDTAPAYGEAEARLGRLLPGPREDWVLVSKAGEVFDGARSHFDFSPAALVASVERSLHRLRTDHLDAVLLHSDGRDAGILAGGALDALRGLQARGLVGAVGMSTKTLEGGLAAVARCDVVMVTWSPNATAEQPVIAAAAASGCGVLVKKALDSGHAPPRAGAIHPFRAALALPGVSAVICGTASPDHLAENVAAVRGA